MSEHKHGGAGGGAGGTAGFKNPCGPGMAPRRLISMDAEELCQLVNLHPKVRAFAVELQKHRDLRTRGAAPTPRTNSEVVRDLAILAGRLSEAWRDLGTEATVMEALRIANDAMILLGGLGRLEQRELCGVEKGGCAGCSDRGCPAFKG